jgi:fructose-bisphosphate aldolase class I
MTSTSDDAARMAAKLVADGKGILAADETVPTLTRRFDTFGIESTEQSRRTYREMLFTSPGAAEFVSGVIMQDETIRQRSSGGPPLAEVLSGQGIARHQGRHRREATRRGRRRDRHRRARRFTGPPPGVPRDGRPFCQVAGGHPHRRSSASRACVGANAHALACYALCQEQHFVPIVEPEVLMDGSHTIERCEAVTGEVLQAVFDALFEQHVSLEVMLLKPNMVIAGKECPRQASVEEVATATLRCLRRHVPAAVPGIVFLSGGQDDRVATAHLNAINRLPGSKPWKISFSYGRALQDPALEAWLGRDENLKAGQQAIHQRARCNSAASLGRYTDEMETTRVTTGSPPHRSGWRDD